MDKQLKVIGSNALVDLPGHIDGVPAKVDTGADSSAIWATDIHIDKKGMLNFTLFDSKSKYYTGEVIKRKAYKVASVRSSSGHSQIRYRTEITMRVGRKRLKTTFNLSDRSKQHFPILIGRRTLANKFLVNVTDKEIPGAMGEVTKVLNEELIKDPYKFFKKYHKQSKKKEAS